MPAPRTPAARPGRRAVLRAGLSGAAVAGVLVLSGCRLRVGAPETRPSTVRPEPTADQLALDRAQVRADQLAALYAQAARLRTDLAPALRQLAADHTAHVQAIEALGGRSGTATSTDASTATSTDTGTTTTDTPTAGSAPTTAPVLTAATALSTLGQAERAAVAEGLADLGPVGPQAARLLASIAACRSAHVAVLSRLPRAAAGRTAGTPTTGPS